MAEEGEAALVVPGYEGERDSAGKRHGAGVATHGNGDVYRGAYRHGRRHGHGNTSSRCATTHIDTQRDTQRQRERETHTQRERVARSPTASRHDSMQLTGGS